jgi:hypothetical protein
VRSRTARRRRRQRQQQPALTQTVPVQDWVDPTFRGPTCGREQRLPVISALREDNFEDWDFTHLDPSDPEYNAEADRFLSIRYLYAITVDALRLEEIDALKEAGIAVATDDGRHVTLEVLAALRDDCGIVRPAKSIVQSGIRPRGRPARVAKQPARTPRRTRSAHSGQNTGSSSEMSR